MTPSRLQNICVGRSVRVKSWHSHCFWPVPQTPALSPTHTHLLEGALSSQPLNKAAPVHIRVTVSVFPSALFVLTSSFSKYKRREEHSMSSEQGKIKLRRGFFKSSLRKKPKALTCLTVRATWVFSDSGNNGHRKTFSAGLFHWPGRLYKNTPILCWMGW